ncbi:MAG: outer membrane protein assembly factor BamB family protein, partial [Anaerolineales bacterium]
GREAWRYQTEGQVNASPVIHKGVAYFGSIDGTLFSLELANGKLRWKLKSAGPITSSPTVANDVVFVGSFDKHLYALAA